MNNRLNAIYGVAWAVVVVACVSGALRLIEAHAAAGDAATNLARLDSLKTAIHSLRKMEDRAQVHAQSKGDSTKALIGFARNASINEKQIIEIEHLPLQKMGNSSYQRDDVFLRIKDINADALITFLVNCNEPTAGYSPVSVQLRAQPTNGQASIDMWSAELVLTRVLFAAKNPTSDL